MSDLLQRLKQRKLVQWALAYAAAAFALGQGVDIIAQHVGWPEQTERTLIVAIAIGFSATLILAWYHISMLAICEAALGNRELALSNARNAIALLPASKDALNGPYHEEVLARIQARLGDIDDAIAGLQRLLTMPFGYFFAVPLTPATPRLDPGFDNLRDDPRFRKLAQMPDDASAPPGGKP